MELARAYFTHLLDKHVCDDRFVQMAKATGIENAKAPMDFITTVVKLREGLRC
jgi:alcohol dehydrogenase